MKTVIFTNSENLKGMFNVENYKSSNRTSLSKMIKGNKERLEEIDSELYPFINAISPQFSFQMDREDLFFVLINENEDIVAALVLGYNPSGWDSKIEYLMHSISVEKEYQGKGLSKELINTFFDFCSKNKISIVKQSPYTKQGKLKIKKTFNETSKKYPEVSFKDTNKKSFFN